MTTGRVEGDGPGSADGGELDRTVLQTPRWRAAGGVLAWLLLLGCGVALFLLFMSMFAMSIGSALHAKRPLDEQVPLFWGFVVVCGVLALVVVLAVVSRRWIALVVALVIGTVGGVAAGTVFNNVSSILTPAVRTSPEPIHCQCSSGTPCGCPGG